MPVGSSLRKRFALTKQVQRLPYTRNESTCRHRFFEEEEGSTVHRPDGRWNVRVGGGDDDRYVLADPLEKGRTLELPAMLNRDSGNLRLFAVDESTPRGVYEMNCRLIDPVTGSILSEDLNAFRVH